MQRFFSPLWNTLFPASCIGCKVRGSALCSRCVAKIPFAPPTGDDRVFALYDYGSRIVEKAVRDLKYYRKSEAALALLAHGAPHLAAFIAEKLQSEHPEPIVFVSIPQHRKKSGERGFSQSELLARALAREWQGARVAPLLRKHRFTLPQAHMKSKSARLTNLNHSMEATKPLAPSLLYILVDDVTTTGATFAEASRALRAAGAHKILSIALAHGYARRK